MNCYYHPNTPAVATCRDCGKAICKDCTTEMSNGDLLCPSCLKSLGYYQLNWLKRFKKRLITGGILGVMFAYLIIKEAGTAGIIWGLVIGFFIACLPVAYFVSGPTPDPYVPTSLESAGKLELLKFAIAFITSPIGLIRGIREYKIMKAAAESNLKIKK